METEVETEGNRFGRPSKWKQSGGGSKERSQRDMFLPRVSSFHRARETNFCHFVRFLPVARNGHLEILSERFRERRHSIRKTANPRAKPVRGQYPAGFARYTPFNLSVLFFI